MPVEPEPGLMPSMLTDKTYKNGFTMRGLGNSSYGDPIESFGRGLFDPNVKFQYEKGHLITGSFFPRCRVFPMWSVKARLRKNESITSLVLPDYNLKTPKNEPIYNEWRSVDVDVLPYILAAFQFGYETPGTYDIDMSYKNVDIVSYVPIEQ